MLCLLLSASTLWATNAGRLQNGAATTGKPIHFSVRRGKASNRTRCQGGGIIKRLAPSAGVMLSLRSISRAADVHRAATGDARKILRD